MTLTNNEHDETIDQLIAQVQSPDPRERSAAVERLGAAQAGLAQLQIATTDRNGYVRAAAADALANFPREEVALYLGDLLFDVNPFVRSAAVRTLGKLGAVEYADTIAEMLDENNPYIRGEVLRALSNMRAAEATEALVAALGDSHRRIRLEAARGLRRMADPVSRPALESVLLQELGQPRLDLPLLNTLVQAISVTGTAEEVGPLLVRMLQEVIGTRTVAARALRMLNYEGARPALERALTDHNPNLRFAGLQALDELGPEPSLPAIRALLQDEEGRVQREACKVLARAGDRETLPMLREMVYSPNPFLRPRAVEGIALLDPVGSRGLLLEVLKDNNMAVREAAVEALAPFREIQEVQEALERARQEEVTDRLRERLETILATPVKEVP